MAKLVLFNKPFQVLSQFTSEESQTNLSKYLGAKACANCYPAGRLDYDSEGLLLLTDDGTLQHRISHPDKKLPKKYWVQLEGEIANKDLDPLRKGLQLKDYRCKPAQVKIIAKPKVWQRNPDIRFRKNDQTSWVEITLKEGKNRQVRKMCAAIGFPCLRLIRHSIGPWSLDDLNPGDFKIAQVHLPKEKKA